MGVNLVNMIKNRKKDSPGQMKLPGFEGSKKKDSSWGHNVVDKTREFFKNRRIKAKETNVKKAISDREKAISKAARDRENEARKKEVKVR